MSTHSNPPLVMWHVARSVRLSFRYVCFVFVMIFFFMSFVFHSFIVNSHSTLGSSS